MGKVGRRLVGLVILVAGLFAALVTPARPAPERLGYEPRDVSVHALTVAGLALGALLATVVAVTVWMGVAWTGRWPDLAPPARGVADAPLLGAPAPDSSLVPDPAAVARRKGQQETAALRAWGWVDRDAGIAVIPIEVAMDLVAERGLPRWSAADAHAEHRHPAPPGRPR